MENVNLTMLTFTLNVNNLTNTGNRQRFSDSMKKMRTFNSMLFSGDRP